jgi:hypothetical protein
MFNRSTERLDAFEKRLVELARRFDDLEDGPGDVKNLRLEFEELKDKVLRWMQRANARKRSDPEDEIAPGGPPPGRPPGPTYLDRMDPISRRIHERRNRGRTTLHLQPGVGVVEVREEES